MPEPCCQRAGRRCLPRSCLPAAGRAFAPAALAHRHGLAARDGPTGSRLPPCSHGRPQSLLCRPGVEGVALKHGQPSALCHFLTWGTLESSSPFKTMEREKQICRFLHIKNPGTYLGILKTQVPTSNRVWTQLSCSLDRVTPLPRTPSKTIPTVLSCQLLPIAQAELFYQLLRVCIRPLVWPVWEIRAKSEIMDPVELILTITES